jgi:hypothetical protein
MSGMIRLQTKESWLGVAPSQLISPHTNPSALITVIIMIVAMVTMLPVVRRPIVIVRAVIPTVIVIIATGKIPVISRIAVAVCGVTESNSDSSDAD